MVVRLYTKPLPMKFNTGGEQIDLETWEPYLAKKSYEEARAKLEQSPKAKKFLSIVDGCAEVVYVLPTKGYFSKYFSPGELKTRYGLELEDKASLITWDPTIRQQVYTINANKPAFLQYMSTLDSKKDQRMEPFMILIHEFGHFLQYLQLPGVYEIKREQTYLEGAQGIRVTDDELENENVQHHEAPVAYELGQPIRFNYWDQPK
jgi:hypothetical protein